MICSARGVCIHSTTDAEIYFPLINLAHMTQTLNLLNMNNTIEIIFRNKTLNTITAYIYLIYNSLTWGGNK